MSASWYAVYRNIDDAALEATVWVTVPSASEPQAGPSGRMAFVDFQNDVTAKDLTLAAREGFRSIEHVKRYTTTGMATPERIP